jgi:hypothetical protein
MGKLLGLHEVSCVIADPGTITTSAASQRIELLASPGAAGPARFLLMCTTAFHFKMGDVTVTAASTSTRVPADTSIVVTVTKASHSYVAVIWETEEGIFQATRLDDEG